MIRLLCTITFILCTLTACVTPAVLGPAPAQTPPGELLIAPDALPRLDSSKPMPQADFLEAVAKIVEHDRLASNGFAQLQFWGRAHDGWASAIKDGTTDAQPDPMLRPIRLAAARLEGGGVEVVDGAGGGIDVVLPDVASKPAHAVVGARAVDVTPHGFVQIEPRIPAGEVIDAAPLVGHDISDPVTIPAAAEPVQNDMADGFHFGVATPPALPE